MRCCFFIILLILQENAVIMKFMTNEAKSKQQVVTARPPIIVILGHVDHGKTTVLDYIRKSNIAEQEPGQITQNIGAFQIEFEKKLFTFIDTPGHEAFSHVRSCGILAADIAILLVAGDEGVKEQTIEAYEQIKNCNVPFLVAINKIDKHECQVEKVKKQLSDIGIFLEGWGGDVPYVEISAKTGKGIREMLELIDLMAQVHNICAHRNENASGIVISSHLNSLDGISAGIVVKDGTFSIRDYIITQSCVSKAVSIIDSFGHSSDKALPSMPVKISRLKCELITGEKFISAKSKKEAKALFEKIKQEKSSPPDKNKSDFLTADQMPQSKENTLFLIIKANEQSQLNAVLNSLEKLVNPYIKIKVIRAALGDISPVDIEKAILFRAKVLGFQVKISSQVKLQARNQKIDIAIFNVIYDLLKAIKENIIEQMPARIIKEIVGSVNILKIFKITKDKILFGGKVNEGKVTRGSFYEPTTTEVASSKGKIIGLQQDKIDADEVLKGRECGILGEGLLYLKEGQTINIFTEKEEKPTI